MRNYQKVLAVIALSSMCWAQAAQQTADTPAKPAKKAPVAHSTKAMRATKAKPVNQSADEMRELKEQLNQQQSALQALQQQLQQTQQQLQQTQGQAKSAQSAAQAAQACCDTNTMQIQKVQADVSDVKATVAANTVIMQKVVKRVDYLENPNSIQYKGIRITPGGQIDVTPYWRQRAALDDNATNEAAIALEGQVNAGYNAHLTESGISARNSRVAVRFEGDPSDKVALASVWELDMYGLGTGANNNQTTSVSPRLRQAWGRAKFANGWKFTAGQDWNLITVNRRGTDADTFYHPNSIDQATQVGPDYIRTGEVRIAKTMKNGFEFAFSLTQPAVIQSSITTLTSTVEGVATVGAGNLGNSWIATCTATPCAAANPYSTNLAPDLLFKLAYDNAKLGHFELKGLGRAFRDRVAPAGTGATYVGGYNNYAYGWGIGGGVFTPILKPGNKLNFVLTGLYGKGIGRYESSQGPDFLVRTATDNQIQPQKSASAYTGFESHPTKKTELDFTLGGEYYWRNLYYGTLAGVSEKPLGTNGVASGSYGNPTSTNVGCYYENGFAYGAANPLTHSTTNPACTGNNRGIYSVKLTGYYDLYNGRFGILRYGAEYNLAYRSTWSGNGGTSGQAALVNTVFAGHSGVSPKGQDTIIMTDVRFILP
jgi:TolA-binding protein